MNVGILTHHWLYNFGANLQALATQQCLQSLGHNPVILNYRPPQLVEKYEQLCSETQKQAHAEFRDRYLIETPVCSNSDEVRQEAQAANLQVVVSGSDAVLRIDNTQQREDLNFPNPFWLDWAVRMGMRTGFLAASSMGSNYLSLPSRTRGEMGRLLQEIDHVGVRDRWTKLMLWVCNRQANIHFCPDPVSVFNEVVSDELYPCPANEDYILVSLYKDTRNEQWIRNLIDIAHAEGLKVFSLPHPELELEGPFDRVLRLPMSPLQWYAWLKHAKGYIGVRFHPIMISLVNKVPFVALDQYESALRFRNRYVTRFATALILPWRRNTSKTYDLARRADRVEYCLNRRQYSQKSAESIFDMLKQQWGRTQESSFVDSTHSTFKSVLNQILGS